MFRIGRLSEVGPDNLGPAITDNGLMVGQTPLVERRSGRYVVRERAEVELLWGRARFDHSAPEIDSLMSGLATVAAALNANDQCLARIAAVHLKIPDLWDDQARYALEAEDALIKLGFRQFEASATENAIGKASPDDPEHPGWPKGTPDGKGGQFRPKTDAEIGAEAKARLIRLAARRALRIGSLKLLRLVPEAAANVVPILDVAADAAMALDIADAVAQYWKLATDITAAFDFANQGPHSFEDLQVSPGDYEQFSSYGDFVKLESALAIVTKRFGPAGDGYQYHHIVTQGGANADNIPAEQLQNTDNVIRLPTLLHEAVNGEYARVKQGTDITEYEWVQTQPYDVQREEGLRILRNLNILK
jgi:hypothetical protein